MLPLNFSSCGGRFRSYAWLLLVLLLAALAFDNCRHWHLYFDNAKNQQQSILGGFCFYFRHFVVGSYVSAQLMPEI